MIASTDATALRRARAEGRALMGFSIHNLEQGLGVVRAAQAAGVPVLLQAGSSAFRYAGREPLARLALGLAESASVPVGVHLDHCTDLDEIEACLRLGYTSVMFDGSGLPVAQNIRLTRTVVALARRSGAWVEAELAGIGGDEDRSGEVPQSPLTDPEVASTFVAATGVDALAVSIGNVHGIPRAPVSLDFELLQSIEQAVEIPLVLHGVSGLPDRAVLRAVRHGVAKLNVNTELRHAFRAAWLMTAERPPEGDAIVPLLKPLVEATERLAHDRLSTFTVAPPVYSSDCRTGD